MAQPVTAAQIAARARTYGLDPNAVLAVASKEGLGGGIGDSGTSFGPFQLHYGGAYPSSAPQGAAASQEWAWSPAGVDYALRQIDQVAHGLTGAPAITNIVSRFERPADIPGEIRGALAAYGAPAAAGPIAQGGATPAATPDPIASQLVAQPQHQLTAVPDRAGFATALLGGIDSKGQLGTDALLGAITARQNLIWR